MNRSLASKIEAANSVLFANGSVDAVGEFFTPDYVAHGTDNRMAGHGAIRRLVGMYRRAFPDLRVEVAILVKAKDRVAWQRTIGATHKGTFKGFPATGRRIVGRDMVISRFRDSRPGREEIYILHRTKRHR
jgi:predicted ester cyclase